MLAADGRSDGQRLGITGPVGLQFGHPLQFEVARRIAAMTPGDLDYVFFANSGSEAVDSAMKMALQYHRAKGQPQRVRFVCREKAYHGVNFGGTSLSGMVRNRETFGPLLAGMAAPPPGAPMALPTNVILGQMLRVSSRISDLIFSPGRPPQVERHGELVAVPQVGLDELQAAMLRIIASAPLEAQCGRGMLGSTRDATTPTSGAPHFCASRHSPHTRTCSGNFGSARARCGRRSAGVCHLDCPLCSRSTASGWGQTHRAGPRGPARRHRGEGSEGNGGGPGPKTRRRDKGDPQRNARHSPLNSPAFHCSAPFRPRPARTITTGSDRLS